MRIASGRRLTLYVRKEAGLTDAAFRFAERGDFGAFYWIDRSLAYALAGRLDRNELMRLASSIYGQLGGLSGGRPRLGQLGLPGSARRT